MKLAVVFTVAISILVACEATRVSSYYCEFYDDDCATCVSFTQCQFCPSVGGLPECQPIATGECSAPVTNGTLCPTDVVCNIYDDCTSCKAESTCRWADFGCISENDIGTLPAEAAANLNNCSAPSMSGMSLNGLGNFLVSNSSYSYDGFFRLTGTFPGKMELSGSLFELTNYTLATAKRSLASGEGDVELSISYLELSLTAEELYAAEYVVNGEVQPNIVELDKFVNAFTAYQLIEYYDNNTNGQYDDSDQIAKTTTINPDYKYSVMSTSNEFRRELLGGFINITITSVSFFTKIGSYNVTRDGAKIDYAIDLSNYVWTSSSTKLALRFKVRTLTNDPFVQTSDKITFDKTASSLEFKNEMIYMTNSIAGSMSAVASSPKVAPKLSYGGATLLTFSFDTANIRTYKYAIWETMYSIDTAKAVEVFNEVVSGGDGDGVDAKEAALIISAIISACVVITTTLVFIAHVVRNRRDQIMDLLPFMKKGEEMKVTGPGSEELEMHDL